MTYEDPDPRPDPKRHHSSETEGMTDEEFLAFHRAMMARANDEARARRGGRPLRDGDIGIAKSEIPSVYHLMRQKPDGSWERVPDDEVPRYDDREERRR